MVGRRSADDRPISRPMAYLNGPISWADVSADRRPTIGRSSLAFLSADVSADRRPIVKFWDFCKEINISSQKIFAKNFYDEKLFFLQK